MAARLAEREAQELQYRLALIQRVVALRAVDAIEPVWVDEWRVSVRRDSGWFAELVRIRWDELAAMVEAAELGLRRPVVREMAAATPRLAGREVRRA